ncbi:glutaredoxin domain-containing cysteine-rich protein CG12206-like [Daphnia carinata]|uniref:glutaredoxin domain-containing cysteine-rich protein CG12206-like n=1 Tax=Daphnia carinata TaxID=120202 RepID=UPI00257B6F87|nr:glutaredoxin domain-containing cysteine-rich protein CG12206-like [Daphnia carinata]
MTKFKCTEYTSSAGHQNLKFQPSSLTSGTELKKRHQREEDSSSSSGHSDFYYFANRGCANAKSSDEVSTLDSGLSSDTEGFTPPPLPRRVNKKAVAELLDDSQSDVSADSLALNDDAQTDLTSLASSIEVSPATARKTAKALPSNLLSEIRTKAVKLHHYQQPQSVKELGKVLDTQLKLQRSKSSSVPPSRSRSLVLPIPQPSAAAPSSFDPADAYYQRFHMCEYVDIATAKNNNNNNNSQQPESPVDDLSFAGLKDIMNVEKSGQTIRSHKSGTVRGVRNRVRAGITTFLQGKTFKSYAEREHGKVVVYTTSMGVVRQTFQRCLQVQRILGTLLINYEERDVSMNRQVQQELKERMNRNRVVIPQVFVEGQLLGDADAIEKLNETGDLRQILRRYKRVGPETICDSCGGYRYLPCSVCSGSKKSIHRNHFTAEFVALKCITCNEAGLIRCVACSSTSSPA